MKKTKLHNNQPSKIDTINTMQIPHPHQTFIEFTDKRKHHCRLYTIHTPISTLGNVHPLGNPITRQQP